jgi:hypothetical protein
MFHVEAAAAPVSLRGQRRGRPGGVAGGHASRRAAQGCVGLVGAGDASTGDHKVLHLLRDERAQGNVVVPLNELILELVALEVAVEAAAVQRDDAGETGLAADIVCRDDVFPDGAA